MQSIESTGRLKLLASRRTHQGKFWRTQLAGDWQRVSPVPDFPSSGVACTGRVVTGLPSDLAVRLSKASNQNNSALEVILLLACSIVMGRLSGGRDVALGYPLPSFPEIPSRHSSILPIRVLLQEDAQFRELIITTRDRYVDGLTNADFPIAVLAAELGLPTVEQGRHPFVDVAALVEQGNAENLEGIKLAVHLVPSLGDWHLKLVYDDTRWLATTMRRVAERIIRVLDQVTARPDIRIQDIDIFLEHERAALQAFNATAYPYRDTVRLEDVLHDICARDPGRLAFVGDGIFTTRAQFATDSELIRRYVQTHGGGRDVLVAVMVDRSPAMMASIAGVLKAGCAWLPLDASLPDSRLRHMIIDSGVPLILAGRTHTDRARALADEAGCSVLNIETDVASLIVSGEDAPPCDSRPTTDSNDIAYAIYTSGSTGLPKAALVEHHSVFNRIDWMQRAYPLSYDDVVLQKTTIAFDVSVWELFWWAFADATLCLLPPGAERDPAVLIEAIERHKVTVLHFVPSMLHVFLEYVEATACATRLKSLRRVFTSGEALQKSHVEHFHRLLGTQACLVNLYGPTEATVDVTHYLCPTTPQGSVPIGMPIDNTRLYIVDEKLAPQPIDVPGELCIAGTGLARGYLNREQLTAERFVEHPFPGEARIYRTGDLARWRDDGTIEYLGRIDQQVKIRGYRIELGEIEHNLLALDGIHEVVVLAKHSPAGDLMLIAWVRAETGVSEVALRRALGGRLPDYMVPSRVVVVDRFPLTPNGKLDRKALPDPIDDLPFEPPLPGIEASLGDIWAQVLGRSLIGRHDNFFSLGGNSIHFVSVLAKARSLGLTFAFETLFTYPTISALAPHVKQTIMESELASTLDQFALLSEADRRRLPPGLADAYPMTRLQVGLIFENEIARGTAQYHDILTYVIQAKFEASHFTESVRRLVRRNAIFRTSYHLGEFDQYLQQVHDDVPLPLFIEDLRHLDEHAQGEWLADWVQREREHQFDWANGGLVRLHVHVLGDRLFHYSLSQHNSALDGWSITLVHIQIFDEYYNLMRNGTAAGEALLRNHLRDYVELEIASLNSTDDKNFWKRQLSGGRPTRLARWEPESSAEEMNVRFHEVDISRGLSDGLLQLAESLAVPLKTVLMAAHVKFLSVASGERDIVAGYEHSGRPEVDGAEDAIGLFLNTIPLRVDVAQARTWREMIALAFNAEADLLAHRRYPMASIKGDLGVQAALFETAFNYTHFYKLKKLREIPDFELLDVRASSETEFVLRAEFSRHFYTDEVRLSLHYHTKIFSAAQIEDFAETYRHIFELMVKDTDAQVDDEALLRRFEHSAHLNSIGSESEKWNSSDTELAARGAARERNLESPLTSSERYVANIWARVLSVPNESIRRDDNFFELGGNSLAALRVVILMERVITLVEFMRSSSLRALAKLLEHRSALCAGDSILHEFSRGHEAEIAPMLICVPYAGGHAINFRDLAERLAISSPALRVAAVELPGHDPASRGEALVDVVGVARLIVAAIARKCEAAPIFLWGHCVGAAIAVEVAIQLQHLGHPLAGVFVGGKMLPEVESIRESINQICALDDEGLVSALAADTEYNSVISADGDVFAHTGKLLRHDAISAHQYFLDRTSDMGTPILTVPITVVVADDDPYTTEAAQKFRRWELFSSEVKLERVADGGHYFCRTRADRVAQIISTSISAFN